jgi:hypothetical protein
LTGDGPYCYPTSEIPSALATKPFAGSLRPYQANVDVLVTGDADLLISDDAAEFVRDLKKKEGKDICRWLARSTWS